MMTNQVAGFAWLGKYESEWPRIDRFGSEDPAGPTKQVCEGKLKNLHTCASNVASCFKSFSV